MLKSEFQERINQPISDSGYSIAETVYTWHPAIDACKGKDQIAYLYINHGMRIIRDMLPTAEKSKELLKRIEKLNAELNQLREEYRELESSE